MSVLSAGGLALWALVSLGGPGSARADLPLAPECTIEPGLVEFILSTYPEADTDGDGALSRDEVCAHQRRLKEKIAAHGDPVASTDESDLVVGLSTPVEIEKLGCAACGECGDDVASATYSINDRTLCHVDSVDR